MMVTTFCVSALLGSLSEIDIVNRVNSNPNSTWRAARAQRFAQLSRDEIKAMMGAVPPSAAELALRQRSPRTTLDVPSSFDSRTQWKGCRHNIHDQGRCGSCWAFGAAETLGFRFCAAHGVNVTLSQQELLSCANTLKLGCKGGKPSDAFEYMATAGVHTAACIPYTDGGGGAVPACPTACTSAGASADKYHAAPWYAVSDPQSGWDHNAAQIMQEVFANGPVEVTFLVYADLLSYKSGVYVPTSSDEQGYHAVELLGWGADENTGTPYWLLANSWGEQWGESGYFRMYRGYGSDCFLTNAAVAAEPKL